MARPPRNTAKRPAAPAESIDALSFDALRSLAENGEASPHTLALLSHDPLLEVQVTVAWNPRTPALIRSAAATNPRLPLPLIHALAQDPDPVVGRHVARNPRVPYGVLNALTQDPDPEVRRTAEEGVQAWKA